MSPARVGSLRVGSLRVIGLVVRREFLAQVRGKAFVISTIVLLALVGGYGAFVTVLNSGGDSSTVAVAPETAGLVPALQAAARDQGRDLTVDPVADAAAGLDRVRDDDADAALSGPPTTPRVDVAEDLGSGLRTVITAATGAVAQDQVLVARGVDPASVAAARAASGPVVVAVTPPDPAEGLRIALGGFGAFLLFFSIQTYGGMVAQGVVEEKSSRVVELVLATVRPWQLLAGKVLGLGAVGLLQLAILSGAGVAAASAAGLLVGGAPVLGTLISVLVWYLLGFALYATVYAALGSLVSRQEDVQSVLTPVSIVVLAGFAVGLNLLLSDPHSTVLTVMSLVPFYSPLMMPGRIALGVAPVWQIVLAFVLTGAFTAATLAVGGRVYARSVLRTGARVSLRSALTRT